MTAIFVTHDQDEAFELSDRIVVLDRGRLQQVGTPEALYHHPANPFVAAFLGRANFLEGRIVKREGEWLDCEMPGGARWRVRVAGEEVAGHDEGARIQVMIRPEALRLLPAPNQGGAEPHDPAELTAEIVERSFAGATTLYRVRVGDHQLSALGRAADGRAGDMARLRLMPDAIPLAFSPDPKS
jgi:spermidine/putrescine transport system ATP-binding protein